MALTDSTTNPKPKATPGDHLNTDHLVADLRGQSLRGAGMAMTSQGIKFLLALTATAVLARILTPADFGLIAMVATITGFINLFADMGLAMATVQRAEINEEQVSTLFWINVALGSLVMMLTAAIAPLVVWFYGEDRLFSVCLALAICFLFSGLGIQHRALLRRQMRFKALAIVEIVAVFAGMIVALLLAWQGHGYWSLVWMHVSTGAMMTTGLWLASGWRPGGPVRGAGVRSMLAFGGNLTGSNIISFVTRNVDNVLIGWHSGTQSLGLYAKAYQLLMLPIQQVNAPASGVAIPTLSRLQHDPERYRAYYRRGVQLMVTIGMPVVAFLFVAASDVVRTVLGPRWMASVPIFHVLGPAAFVGTFNVATHWVFVSLGHTDRQLRWSMFAAVVTVTGFAIGIYWGAIGVAASFSVTFCALRYPGIAYCFKNTPLAVSDLLTVLWRPAAAAALAGAGMYGLAHWLPHDLNPLLRLGADMLIYAAMYPLAWCMLPNGPAMLRGMWRLATELIGWNTPESPLAEPPS